MPSMEKLGVNFHGYGGPETLCNIDKIEFSNVNKYFSFVSSYIFKLEPPQKYWKWINQ